MSEMRRLFQKVIGEFRFVTPRLETPPPAIRQHTLHIQRQIGEFVLPVADDGIYVILQIWLENRKVGQVQRFVDLPHLTNRILLKVFKRQFVKVPGWDQVFLFKECVIDSFLR